MKRLLTLVLLGCALLARPALLQAQKFIFTPQWTAQAQFAGYYVAQDMGFYKDAGLDVEIVHPSATESAMNRINDNKSHAITLMLPQAMEFIDSGVRLVNILQTSMNSGLVIVSRRNEDPLKQKGIRVGVWSAGFDQLPITMSLKENLDFQWIRFASGINLMLSGAIDATVAMSYNEYYQLMQAGVELTDTNVYRFCDHGYNVQEDGVYVTLDFYKKNKEAAIKFAEASRRGWEWAVEHPGETLDIVMKYVREGRVETNRILQELMLEEILRLQVDRESGKREFRLRPDMVQQMNQLMVDNQLLLNGVTYEDLIAQ
jgi:NitT/TauT family transport system substrate-binding protein